MTPTAFERLSDNTQFCPTIIHVPIQSFNSECIAARHNGDNELVYHTNGCSQPQPPPHP